MTPERALEKRIQALLEGVPFRAAVHQSGGGHCMCFMPADYPAMARKVAAFAAGYAKEHNDGRDEELQTVHDAWSRAVIELAAARQREEEAKGRLAQCEASWHQLDAACQVRFDEYRAEVRQKSDMIAALTESNSALRAENDRLTLAASESARTLQVELERLKGQEEVHWKTRRTILAERDALRDELEKIIALRPHIEQVAKERDALQAQVTALREALETHGRHSPACDIFMPPGTPCTCGLSAALAAIPQDGA